eukprot:1805119-Rhodomonas_salina.1
MGCLVQSEARCKRTHCSSPLETLSGALAQKCILQLYARMAHPELSRRRLGLRNRKVSPGRIRPPSSLLRPLRVF